MTFLFLYLTKAHLILIEMQLFFRLEVIALHSDRPGEIRGFFRPRIDFPLV